MKKLLSENAIHDPATPKFHYCLKKQNVPIFASNLTALLMGVLNCFCLYCYVTVP